MKCCIIVVVVLMLLVNRSNTQNAVTCSPEYTTIPNGIVNCDGNSVLDTCSFTCNTGYWLVGLPFIFCDPDGMWTSDAQYCLGVTCNPQSTRMTNGNVACDGNSSGDQCIFTCDTGYQLNGYSTLTCIAILPSIGTWDHYKPACQDINECNDTPTICGDNEWMTFCSNTPGSYNCYCAPPEYTGGGDATPCIALRCNPEYTTMPNGIVKCDGNSDGDQCVFTCNTGYQLNGNSILRCNANGIDDGMWDDDAPTCQRCGELHYESSGTLQSPNHPEVYDNDHDCEWKITVPADEVANFKITFISFHVEPYVSCNHDFLEIYNGSSHDSPLLGRFCGASLPPTLHPTNPTVTLWFKTDGARVHSGWRLFWTTQEDSGCGEDLYGSSGTLQSPNYPEVYDNDQDCKWKITVPADEVANFKITFLSFHVEPDHSCIDDFLDIYDGPSRNSLLLGRFCGTSLPPTLHPTNPAVTVWFKTDSYEVRSGWRLLWTTQEDLGCGEELYGSSGILHSPNHPEGYDNGHVCEWKITVPADKVANFTITFLSFHVEPAHSCVLEIYDGPFRDSPLLGRFCGTSLPPTLHPTNPTVTVWFKTDGTQVHSGWRLSWTTQDDSGCGEPHYGSSGILHSPNHPEAYDNGHVCLWKITVPTDEVANFEITFIRFNVEPHVSCNDDFLEIYDGPSRGKPLLGRFCGTSLPPTLHPTNPTVTVWFITNGARVHSGWRLFWTTQEDSAVTCSPEYTTIPNGIVNCDGNSYGDQCVFTCNTGYQLNGNPILTCNGYDDGMWNGDAPTCQDVDECASNPCQNGGVCNDMIDSFTCTCANGFVGPVCDYSTATNLSGGKTVFMCALLSLMIMIFMY